MKAHSTRMSNEHGETVIVDVRETNVEGLPGLELSLNRPDGTQELLMTKKEAVEILDALSKMMRPRSRS